MAYKYTVVGGVAIPNYVKGFAALVGLSGGLSYLFHHEMKSVYGEKYPNSITTFMIGNTALGAGATAHQLYVFNKNLALMRELDKKVHATLTVRKSPSTQAMYTAGSLMLMAYCFILQERP